MPLRRNPNSPEPRQSSVTVEQVHALINEHVQSAREVGEPWVSEQLAERIVRGRQLTSDTVHPGKS